MHSSRVWRSKQPWDSRVERVRLWRQSGERVRVAGEDSAYGIPHIKEIGSQQPARALQRRSGGTSLQLDRKRGLSRADTQLMFKISSIPQEWATYKIYLTIAASVFAIANRVFNTESGFKLIESIPCSTKN